MKKVSAHEALVYLMVTVAAADEAMTDAELSQIGNVVRTLPIFRDFDRDQLVAIAGRCSKILEDDDGLGRILDIVHDALPAKLYETAYAVAVEVAAADLHVEQEELRLLQMLRDRLDLDKLAVGAIEHSARVRYRIL
jgi:tellurite resistance protein